MNEIGKWNRSLRNRVQSIVEDSEFVSCVSDAYGLPLVPNKRCGLWYVPPEHQLASAYFKSTDGHTSQWKFSVKRLNLHLIPLIVAHKGIVLVDSTRRGKRMPDAFSKTVPAWCAVISKALGFDSKLYCPPRVVSPSEHDQMSSLIPQWTEHLQETLGDLVAEKAAPLDKPLRPIWVTPDGLLPGEPPQFDDFYPVVLCTASQMVQDGAQNSRGYVYIQGAADDHELWAGSLTPDLLWAHEELRENVGDHLLEARVAKCLEMSPASVTISDAEQVTPHFRVAYWPVAKTAANSIDLRESADADKEGCWPLGPGKKGVRKMAGILGNICTYFESHRDCDLIIGDKDEDSALCIAHMLDCLYFDEDGSPLAKKRGNVPKPEAARRLAKLAAAAGTSPHRMAINIIGTFMRP